MHPELAVTILDFVAALILIPQIFNPPEITMSTPPSRSPVVDAFRGISISAIVLIHIHSYIEYYHKDAAILPLSFLYNNLARFATPAFVITAGIFLSYRGFKEFWTPKILRIYLPYTIIAFWGWWDLHPEISAENLQAATIAWLTGTVYAPHYFLVLLAQIYLVFLVLRKIPHRFLKPALPFLVVFQGISVFKISPGLPGWLAQSIVTNFITCLVWGILIRSMLRNPPAFESWIRETVRIPRLLVWISIHAAAIVYYSMVEKAPVSNRLPVYAMVCFLLGFIWLSGLANSEKKPALQFLTVSAFIGKRSLSVFILHPLIMHYLHWYDPFITFGQVMVWPWVLAINVGVPVLLSYLLGRLVTKEKVVVVG